jgi:hypothetical protein
MVWRSLISTTPALALFPDKLPAWQALVAIKAAEAPRTVTSLRNLRGFRIPVSYASICMVS